MSGAVLAALSRPLPATFLAAGTGAVEAPISGTLQVPYPASIVVGNFLVLHVYAQDAAAATITTPAGWTLIDSRNDAVLNTRSAGFYKAADGTETGNLDVTATADIFAAGRIYRFSRGRSVESASGAMTTASGTSMDAVDVTTLSISRLPVQLMAAGVNTTIGNISGETGSDYTEAVAEYSSATGPIVMSCQVALAPTAVAITGGSATLGAAGTSRARHGFAIVP